MYSFNVYSFFHDILCKPFPSLQDHQSAGAITIPKFSVSPLPSIEHLNYRSSFSVHPYYILRAVQFAKSDAHDIFLQCVPGHSRSPGNVLANRLAYTACSITGNILVRVLSGDLRVKLKPMRHHQSPQPWFNDRTNLSFLFTVDPRVIFPTATSFLRRVDNAIYKL